MSDPLQTGSLRSYASLIDAAALRFEQAWADDPAAPPAPEAFLPPDPAAGGRAALRLSQIDLERRTAAGFDPRAETYLGKFPTLAADPDDVFALVATEAEARLRHGRPVDPDDLRRRFPQHANRVVARLLRRSVPRVPGYEVLGELGKGGMGVVYKARQTKLNRVVALKVVTAPDRQAVNRFLLEAEAVAAVRHPHVVQVFDSGEHDDLPYLAMELLDGGSLKDRLGRVPDHRLRSGEAAVLVAAVADGVQAVHEAGIVHRDLKPGNVLFDEKGSPKVADFGLAMRGGVELTGTGVGFLGTPAYAAPEQAAGKREFVGPAADVWGLGVILYECLTGRRPFDGDDPLSVMQKVQKDAPTPPRAVSPAVPRDLELICLKCLGKEPRDRYPTAAALAADLRNYLDGKPVTARPVGPLTQAAKWVRRNPVPAALVAAVLVGSVAITAAALVARDEARKAAHAERAEAAEKAERGRAERDATINAALRGNDLQRVVDVVAEAERQGLPVPPEARFEAANALMAIARTAEARERLNALASAPDVPPALRARVELTLADFLYGEDDARATRLLRSARASGLLSPADLAYADAVEAETMPEAIGRLRDAVRHDPRHFPARRTLGLCLCVTGGHAEAIAVGEVSRMLTRNHPEVLWPLFFCYGFKGDAARTREVFALLRPNLPPDIAVHFEMLAKYLPILNHQFLTSIGGRGVGSEPLDELFRELEQQGGAHKLLTPLQANNLIKTSLLGRMPPAFRDALDDYLEYVYATTGVDNNYVETRARDEVKLARLKRNMERRPEGWMLFLYAFAQTERAFAYLNRHPKNGAHLNRFREMALIAADAYRRAADSPGLIDARSVALEGAALHYAVAARPIWVPESGIDWGAYRKAVEMVKRRLDFPESIIADRYENLSRICRRARDYTTGRRVIDGWERSLPADPAPALAGAEMELAAEAHAPALRAARRAEALANFADALLVCGSFPHVAAVRHTLYRSSPGPATRVRVREIVGECLLKLRRDPDLPPEPAPAPRPKNP